ncbi:patatin-like phospholipase family protein [Aspergillus affinis]|uniref:patatin-like phospholipase family protein n=1 Tax=Aspergillus affinis TaxID=1070780 RepID=UPI0022FF3B36|nr:FabD/lysophospholipase-like protein [Aspergillus affinis]KAI9039861.1 FabD/lysophospholipase-like protein [Aspergillus affinis]
MDTDTQTDASYDSAGQRICDLCDCIRELSNNVPHENDLYLTTQAINCLCNSVDQLTVVLRRELEQTTENSKSLQLKVAEMEREQSILLKKLHSTERAYEAKEFRVPYPETTYKVIMAELDWLRPVSNSAGTFVHHGRCLSHIKEQLSSPQTQFPGLTLFLGQRRRDIFLRYMFPENKISKGNSYLRLQIDNQRIFTEQPILFASCNPHLSCQDADPGINGQEEIPIRCTLYNDRRLLDLLLARLVFMFVDVICIFADDVGGLDAVRTALATWATLGCQASSLEHRPRLVVVSESSGSVTQDLLDQKDFHSLLEQSAEVSNAFGTPSMLFLRQGGSDIGRYRPVKDEIMIALDLSRRHRKEEGYLFSGIHLERFFYRALLHICRTTEESFDFVRSARDTFQTRSHSLHLQTFLELTERRPWNDRARFVASTILVDAYLPGEHWRPSADYQRIVYHFAQLYHRILFGQGPSRRIHQSTLDRWKGFLSHMFTNQTCLICLTRPPQHTLNCGHAYCDICVVAYSKPLEGTEYKYLLSHCVLCRSDCNNLVRILPPTACVRAVTVDGGGVRGFIPLQFLKYMQYQLGQECPIQELFDIAFGTSSGGFAVLKLFHQRQSVNECVKALSDLMWQFLHQNPAPRSIWAKVGRAIRCWWTDGWYSANAWDELLQQQFGPSQEMFGTQPISGTKVAVTASAEHPVLLPNYRRDADAPESSDRAYYHVHQAVNKTDEPKVWQCARATTAAPMFVICLLPLYRGKLMASSFFPPIEIRGIGRCEDGGLKCNNPALICRSEIQSLWPSRPEPGALISLGTGSAALDRRPSTTRRRDRRQRWASGFAFRLYDSFMASMDAEQAWRGLLGQVDEASRQKYHRLNVEFPDKEPLLNAAEKVQWMVTLADQEARVKTPSALTSLLLASLFLELSLAPRWEDGHYHCNGAIRCRLPGEILVKTLRKLHPDASTYIMGGDQLSISPYEDAICQSCERYCVPIRFTVKELDSPISLSLQLTRFHTQRLGGFPSTLRWFLDRQGLDTVGHTANLRNLPTRAPCKSCDVRVNRKSALIQLHRQHKKRVRFI